MRFVLGVCVCVLSVMGIVMLYMLGCRRPAHHNLGQTPLPKPLPKQNKTKKKNKPTPKKVLERELIRKQIEVEALKRETDAASKQRLRKLEEVRAVCVS